MATGTWPLGWATGDVVTAAEYAKGMGAIYDTTLGVAAATIDITPVVTSYAHLRLVLYARGDTAAATFNPTMKLNNDGATNYDYQGFFQNNGAITANAPGTGQSTAAIGYAPAASALANSFGVIVVDIPFSAGATNFKTWVAAFFAESAASASGLWTGQYGGVWKATPAAVTRLTLGASAGNYAAGTRATLYAAGA